MKIATYNVNGIKARLEAVLAWLAQAAPDVVCLQEIKSLDEGFPIEAFQSAGWNVEVHGQKGFNGVALVSRTRAEDVLRGLPGDNGDAEARYIEATFMGAATAVRVGGLYLPNGNPIGSDRFAYKLAWMRRLEAHVADRLADDMPLVFAGDYNVMPEPADAKQPALWVNDALYQPESRAAWRRLVHLGMTDAIRATHPEPGHYTFWDYQAGAWQKNNGIRIDHLLLSPQAADRLTSAGIDKHVRGREKPSDHVPVWVDLEC